MNLNHIKKKPQVSKTLVNSKKPMVRSVDYTLGAIQYGLMGVNLSTGAAQATNNIQFRLYVNEAGLQLGTLTVNGVLQFKIVENTNPNPTTQRLISYMYGGVLVENKTLSDNAFATLLSGYNSPDNIGNSAFQTYVLNSYYVPNSDTYVRFSNNAEFVFNTNSSIASFSELYAGMGLGGTIPSVREALQDPFAARDVTLEIYPTVDDGTYQNITVTYNDLEGNVLLDNLGNPLEFSHKVIELNTPVASTEYDGVYYTLEETLTYPEFDADTKYPIDNSAPSTVLSVLASNNFQPLIQGNLGIFLHDPYQDTIYIDGQAISAPEADFQVKPSSIPSSRTANTELNKRFNR